MLLELGVLKQVAPLAPIGADGVLEQQEGPPPAASKDTRYSAPSIGRER
jgi:hypothetical protein